MRIEGKDASTNIALAVRQDVSIKPESRDVSDVRAAAPVQLEGRNITQLTEYEKRELPISEKVVLDAIERANKAISGGNRKFEFSIHEKTKEIMVKVIDSDTNKVIREIPPEKILDMVAKIWEMAGIIVDERR